MPSEAEEPQEPGREPTLVELTRQKGVEAAEIEQAMRARGETVDEETVRAILRQKSEELHEELRVRSQPPPRQCVRGGVDAEAVEYLLELEKNSNSKRTSSRLMKKVA